MITQTGKTIHLQGRDISYIMFENECGDLLHFYFGKKLSDCDYSNMKEEWTEEDEERFQDAMATEREKWDNEQDERFGIWFGEKRESFESELYEAFDDWWAEHGTD